MIALYTFNHPVLCFIMPPAQTADLLSRFSCGKRDSPYNFRLQRHYNYGCP